MDDHQDAAGRSLRPVSVDPSSDPAWSTLVDAHRTDVFHSPAWADVLSDTYGFDVIASVAIDQHDRPVGGLIYVEVDDVKGPRLISLPFSDFCDPIFDSRGDLDVILEELLARGEPLRMRCLRLDRAMLDDRLSETGRLGWHAIDTVREPDRIWSEVSASARRAIRKSESAAVEVRPAAGSEDLRSFFELHLRVRKHKYGLLAQPYRFFESIWERFVEKDKGTLLLAWKGGRVIAGVMYLEWKDTLYYKFNASDPDELQSRPNDALLWGGIQHGHSRGLAKLDFGVSDLDQEGLLRYKRKYATEEGTVHVFAHYPDGYPTESGRRAGSLLADMTGLFVDPAVPDHVTEAAGDKLYHLFA